MIEVVLAALMVAGHEAPTDCASCHAPGGLPQTELVAQGVFALVELGCVSCHMLPEMMPNWQAPWAPALSIAGRHNVNALRRMVTQPIEHFGSKTHMPSFVGVAAAKPAWLDGVIAFLSLQRAHLGQSPARAPAVDTTTCASCHRGSRANQASQYHRCAWIARKRPSLHCTRCHSKFDKGACVYLEAERAVCGGCHVPKSSVAKGG